MRFDIIIFVALGIVIVVDMLTDYIESRKYETVIEAEDIGNGKIIYREKVIRIEK